MVNKKEKFLFLLHEGVGDTIFNSQVAEHVKSMKEYGYSFDILSFNVLDKVWDLSKKNEAKFKKKYPNQIINLKKGVNIFYPLFNLINAFLFIRLLKNKKYNFIHARADYSAFIANITKFYHKTPVYWDCRGDTISELKDVSKKKSLLIRVLVFIYILPSARFRNFINSRLSDKIIFVSKSLKETFTYKTKIVEVIPCPVAEDKFSFSIKEREKTRKELGYLESEIVFVYSGSMVKYQYIRGVVDFLKRVKKKNTNSKVLILTSEIEKAKLSFKGVCENIKIMRVPFEEMYKYYSAADIGILLRETNRLNKVASPTKFGEYCLTGLQVVLNDTVDQAKEFSERIGNYNYSSKTTFTKPTYIKREKISLNALDFFSRNVLDKLYLSFYERT